LQYFCTSCQDIFSSILQIIFVFSLIIVVRYALHAAVELQAMAAFLGGVLAQEVVKVTGKFTPIPGFLHFAAMEALPDEEEGAEVRDVAPRGSPQGFSLLIHIQYFVEVLSSN